MLPINYNPTTIEGFIGPARKAAEMILRMVAFAKRDAEPLRIVFSGAPGIGKSKLANFTAAALGANRWTLTKMNATQVKIEEIEEIAQAWAFTNIFGGYRAVQIEELDKMPSVARSRILTLCDDLPSSTALIATTNQTPEQMRMTNPTMERRYTWLELEPPTDEEIYQLLRKNWPEIPEERTRFIAVMASGCVGRALAEATLWYTQEGVTV